MTNTVCGWSFAPPSLIGGTAVTGIYQTVDQSYIDMTRRNLGSLSYWQKNSVINQLQDISHLTDDWDGYGGASIEKNAVVTAKNLVDNLTEFPAYVLPSTAGTLLLKWVGPRGKASLELGRETFSFYAAPEAGSPKFLSGDTKEIDAEKINTALSKIVGYLRPWSLEDSNQIGGFTSIS